jgi:fibronectin type 3 domain-containing protein
VGAYDRSLPLVIDPVIVFSTYLGGAAADTCFGVAVNADGEAFVAGSTLSLDLPTTPDAYQPDKAGSSAGIDAFVARFSAAGDELIYLTYCGGSSDDEAFGIAVGSDDRAVFTGSTLSSNFPTTSTAFDRTYHGQGDAFVARLSADGSDLSFSTFVGGAGNDVANAIALDSSRRAYITGYTESGDFPTTAGVIDRGHSGFRDAFITRLGLNGDELLASTFLGGGGVDEGRALAVADSGDVVATGATESDNFPSTGTSFEPFRQGTTDAFVVRVSQDLGDFTFGGFLGGLNLDAGTAIALDDDENVGVAGETASNGLDVTDGAFDQTFNGGTRDAFVARITPLGDAISYCTYLGGTSDDGATGIAFDPAGNLHVAGFTHSVGFPVVDALFDSLQGGYDAFVAEVLPTQAGDESLRWSTYYGGEDDDAANAIALTPGSNTATFIAGETLSDTFPVEGGVQSERAAQSDGFLAKVSRQAPLAAPTGLDAVASAGRVDLTWNDNSTGESGFEIERKTDTTEFIRIATAAANAEAYADTDVDPNTAYTYRVRAVAADNASPYSNEASATTPALDVPTAPNNLTATAVSTSEIDLEWVDRSDNETGFKIERRKGTSGTFTQIDTVDADVESYNDTGLLSDTTYQYRVRAFNSDGNSDYSNVATATTLAKPAGPNAPSALRATINSSRSVTLTWQDNSDNESGFQLERAAGIGDFVRIITLGPNTTTFTDNALQPNTVYRYRIRAVNENGASAYSNTVQVRTPVDPPTEPAAPTNLVATPTAGQVLLTWEDNSNNESTFAIERKLEDGGFQPLTSVGQNTTRYVDQAAGGNARYTYRVRAVNSGGESDYATSAEILTLPTAPTNVTAAATSPTSIQLTWHDTNVRPADTKIERSEDGGNTFTQIALVDAGRATFSDEGLQPNKRYHYRLRATNPSGNSAFSATVSATTPQNDGGKLIVRKKLSFGVVRRGSAKVKNLTIGNAGTTQTLSVTVGEVGSPFRIVSGGGELAIPPSGSRTVQIEFQPRGRGKVTRTLKITSSDPDRPRVNVKLIGSGK